MRICRICLHFIVTIVLRSLLFIAAFTLYPCICAPSVYTCRHGNEQGVRAIIYHMQPIVIISYYERYMHDSLRPMLYILRSSQSSNKVLSRRVAQLS